MYVSWFQRVALVYRNRSIVSVYCSSKMDLVSMIFKSLEPRRATIGSAGYDFFSPNTYVLKPNEWTMIDTEVALDDNDLCVDFGKWFMLVVPRSGLASKYGMRFRTTVGVIDMDYRNSIKCEVTVDTAYTLSTGERFAQGIILPYGVFHDEIKPTATRNGGFGSTGRM